MKVSHALSPEEGCNQKTDGIACQDVDRSHHKMRKLIRGFQHSLAGSSNVYRKIISQ